MCENVLSDSLINAGSDLFCFVISALLRLGLHQLILKIHSFRAQFRTELSKSIPFE
jgi:hypothetical protein